MKRALMRARYLYRGCRLIVEHQAEDVWAVTLEARHVRIRTVSGWHRFELNAEVQVAA